MIYFFGDVHFSSMNAWSHDIGDCFINWFKAKFINENKTNYIIFLGDITEKDSNPGDVVDQMYKLFEFCNNHFKQTYILMGNHDLKLFRGHTLQTSLKFLNNFKDVEVIDSVKGISIENKNILCIPHVSSGEVTVENYYNKYDWSEIAKSGIKYNLAIGHWIIKDENNIRYRYGVDTTRIPLDLSNSPIEGGVLCGHIHNRPYKYYIGSIWPAKVDETKCNFPRCFIKWSDTWEEELLPDFVKFDVINYGDEISFQNDCVHLYIIQNAPSEGDARRKYAGFYIKSVQMQRKNKDVQAASTSTEDFLGLDMDDWDLFLEMVKEKNLVVSRKAFKIMEELLKKRKNKN
jgi:DNA repair exonuclease SbcCD nuclease subunit